VGERLMQQKRGRQRCRLYLDGADVVVDGQTTPRWILACCGMYVGVHFSSMRFPTYCRLSDLRACSALITSALYTISISATSRMHLR